MSHNTSTSCGCLIAILALNLTVGAMCFAYSLRSILGADVPWWADALGGLFLGQITIPLAVICWVLRLAGLDAPFLGGAP